MFDRLRTVRWFWKYRHLWNPKWTDGYKNLNAPHRKVLAYKVLEHNPKHILEVGCGVGANLRLIHGLRPASKLFGIDINSRAIKEAKEWNSEFAEFYQYGFDRIPIPDNWFDIAFTDTSFMYARDKVKALKELKRVAKKVILYEWETLIEVL